MIENIINTTISNFDFSFCIIVNILTYIIIKVIDELNGTDIVSKWQKRIILISIILALSIVYHIIGVSDKIILNSAILAPVFWSWILKPICKYLGVDYKDINIDN